MSVTTDADALRPARHTASHVRATSSAGPVRPAPSRSRRPAHGRPLRRSPRHGSSAAGGRSQATLGRSGRLPGLDGIRGLAVLAVVVFHLWPAVLPGGFLGVSVFFTLSGFVITRGLLDEHDRTGTIALRAFWGRRVRRLWPAAAATLAAIVLLWSLAGWTTRSIGADTLASFLHLANWRFVAAGDAYGVATDSPVAHFWSLAIEEQLYLLVPVVVWALRRRRGWLAAALTAGIAGSAALSRLDAGDATTVYYSTGTRAGELLVGALFAVLAHRAPARVEQAAPRHLATAAGAVGLSVLAVLGVVTTLGSPGYYEGGLLLVAVASTAALVGAIWSPVLVRALSMRWLQWVGAASYGIYLVHWPVHVALDRTPLAGPARPYLALAITLALAAASRRFLEEPVRTRRVARRPLAVGALALGIVVLLGAGHMATATPKAREIDFAGAALRMQQIAASPAAPLLSAANVSTVAGPELPVTAGSSTPGEVATAPSPSSGALAPMASAATPVVATPPPPLRVAIFGDSTALMLGPGLRDSADPRLQIVGGYAKLGCPLGRGGDLRGDAAHGNDTSSVRRAIGDECDWGHWAGWISEAGGVDTAIVLTGGWDIAGRRIAELGNRWRTVGDPVYDEWLLGEMGAAIDAMHDAGARRVLWLDLPPMAGTPGNGRVDRFNELVHQVVADRPWAAVADYAAYLRDTGRDVELRPDGVHLTEITGVEVGRTWLNAILAASR